MIGRLRISVRCGNDALDVDYDALVSGSWGNLVVNVRTLEVASTSGGARVHLQLLLPLSQPPASLRAAYSNGRFYYLARDCAVLPPELDVVACVLGPGVGSGHHWSLTIDDVSLPPSLVTTSYTHPVVFSVMTGLTMNDARSDTFRDIRIHGRDFGNDADAISDVRMSDAGSSVYQAPFRLPNCTVVVPHCEILCHVYSFGDYEFSVAHMQIALRVGEQESGAPTVAAWPARIESISGGPWPTHGVRAGQPLVLVGSHLGVAVADVAPEVRAGPTAVPHGMLPFAATACAINVTNRVIVCNGMGPGYGDSLVWSVSLLGFESDPFFGDRSVARYAAPRVWSADVGLCEDELAVNGCIARIRGENFALAYAASATRVIVDGAPVPFADTVVASDDLILAALGCGGAGTHSLVVRVGGVDSSPVVFTFHPPVLDRAVAYRWAAPERWMLMVEGRGLGSAVTADVLVYAREAPLGRCDVFHHEGTRLVCEIARRDVAELSSANATVVVSVRGLESRRGVDVGSGADLTVRLVGHDRMSPLSLADGGTVLLYARGLLSLVVLMQLDSHEAAGTSESGREAVCAAARDALRTRGNACVATVWYEHAVQCTLRGSKIVATPALIVPVTLWNGGCIVGEGRRVQFDPPRVHGLAPARLAGSMSEVVSITGTNFVQPMARLRILVAGAPCVGVRVVNASMMTCLRSGGVGAVLPRARAGGARASSELSPESCRSTAVPVEVDGVQSLVEGPVECAPPRVIAVLPYVGDSGDLVAVVVSGVHGRRYCSYVEVRFGRAVASVWNASDEALLVRVPAAPDAYASEAHVLIAMGDDSVALSAALSYRPPRVTGVTFEHAGTPTDGGRRLTVAFGAARVVIVAGRFNCALRSGSLRVTFAGSNCTVKHMTAEEIACVLESEPRTGMTDVRVHLVTAEARLRFVGVCAPGYYAAAGRSCALCPMGGFCRGGLMDGPRGVPVIALPGYYPQIPNAKYQIPHDGTGSEGQPALFVECRQRRACVGGGACANGYGGCGASSSWRRVRVTTRASSHTHVNAHAGTLVPSAKPAGRALTYTRAIVS